MLYAAILHSLAGAVTGSVFKIGTLLCLLIFVLAEAAILSVVDFRAAALWALINLATIQLCYLAGVFFRRTLEHAGYLLPSVRIP